MEICLHFYVWIELKGTLLQKLIEPDLVGHHAGIWGLVLFYLFLGVFGNGSFLISSYRSLWLILYVNNDCVVVELHNQRTTSYQSKIRYFLFSPCFLFV